MKKLYTLTFVLATVFTVVSQNKIKLNINHKLGASAFAVSQTATNNLGDSFNLDRMQYYMSGFVITHDGAQSTTLTGVYALVDAAAPALIDLGNHSGITNVEAIKFSIGVNTPENNADPSLWPSDHPLSPKSPSMHWGWASGYFFIALGGNASPLLNQKLELHALDNTNYFSQSIVTTATESNNEKIINIDADYEMALKDISVASGLVLHGSSGDNAKMITNFRDFVFSPTELNPVGIAKKGIENGSFTLYPNPSNTGIFTISPAALDNSYNYRITNVTGQIVEAGEIAEGTGRQIIIQSKGLYFLTLFDDNGPISTKKLIVH